MLKSTWIPGLFNPMAFLTAVMQVTARNKQLPLDYMTNRATFLRLGSFQDAFAGLTWKNRGLQEDRKWQNLHEDI